MNEVLYDECAHVSFGIGDDVAGRRINHCEVAGRRITEIPRIARGIVPDSVGCFSGGKETFRKGVVGKLAGYRSKQGLSRPPPRQVKAVIAWSWGHLSMRQNWGNGKGLQACHGNIFGRVKRLLMF
jgi:hypothetical protein